MARITEKQLQTLKNKVAARHGLSSSHSEAKEKGHEFYVILDNCPHYGGYRLNAKYLDNGREGGVFGFSGECSRISASQMFERLNSL